MKNNPFDNTLFAGKNVLITGAGRGIGLAIANAFKQCGASITAHSGRATGTSSAKSLEGIADLIIEADFSYRQGVSKFIDDATINGTQFDVVINNAGTMLGRFPANELTDEQYDALVMLNQTSVVMVTRGLLAKDKIANGAAIVNTTSISALTGGSPGSSIYSSTKAFVSTYTKALARELAPQGIRANLISPGTIDTDFHERYSSKEKLEATKNSVPLKRLGTAQDCANAYLFLSAPELSGYITGQTLEINGGQLIV